MRLLVSACTAAFLACTMSIVAPFRAAHAAIMTPVDGSTFSVVARTTVPGTVLKPGTYSIRVVDHLSDRVILRIEDPNGKTLTTFLGLPNPSIRNGSGSGAVAWEGAPHKQNALRGFTFPGGSAVEFVYPKADAVEIAKVNNEKVAAIDPASEGRAPSSANLSASDLQMLTLWSLSSTHVGPLDSSKPAIQAERYKPLQEARNSIPAAPQVSRSHVSEQAKSSATGSVASPRAPAATERAPEPQHKSVLKVLPHTASDMPLILLGGLVSLFIVAYRSLRRVTRCDVA